VVRLGSFRVTLQRGLWRSFGLVMLPIALPHELAHLLASAVLGLRPCRLHLGSRQSYVSLRGRSAASGALALSVAAGPASDLAGALAWRAAALLMPAHSWPQALATGFAALSLLCFAANMLVGSDGRVLLALARGQGLGEPTGPEEGGALALRRTLFLLEASA
jgi:hypothetical protein